MMRSKKKALSAMGALGIVSLVLSGCSAGGRGDTGSGTEAKPFGECDISDKKGTYELDTVTDGVLTIAVPWPSPSGYPGESPEEVEGGYLYCLTAEIANRAGLNDVVIETTSFEALITARTQNYDMSLWDVIVTPEREKVVDFSSPYMNIQTGVAVREKDKDMTIEDMPNARLGFLAGSKAEELVAERFPDAETLTFQGNDDMFAALMANQVDMIMNDTITLMPLAYNSGGKAAVIGQFRTDSPLAAVLPKGSPNTAPTSEIIDEMREDGTIDEILTKWLYEGYGGNPDDIPFWDEQ
ncbi:ABC transporter substrate-binding protein [Leucobacter sp. wl10]|uniref:ABC transporter substrate-binding protein n=1 Tax=Leucobacter sp. wl10 TaxID=2304677 RepID=UPI000E5A3929|nr:ABC transporter substrate-binding protein [Leucobacter sp. wl10]RGE20094.1 amino acid ABC transporter substrate-binding protein [Leucobacter sp. wl10]